MSAVRDYLAALGDPRRGEAKEKKSTGPFGAPVNKNPKNRARVNSARFWLFD